MRILLSAIALLAVCQQAAYGFWPLTEVTAAIAKEKGLPLSVQVTAAGEGSYEVLYQVELKGEFAHLREMSLVLKEDDKASLVVSLATPAIGAETPPIKGRFRIAASKLAHSRLHLDCPIAPLNLSGQTFAVIVSSFQLDDQQRAKRMQELKQQMEALQRELQDLQSAERPAAPAAVFSPSEAVAAFHKDPDKVQTVEFGVEPIGYPDGPIPVGEDPEPSIAAVWDHKLVDGGTFTAFIPPAIYRQLVLPTAEGQWVKLTPGKERSEVARHIESHGVRVTGHIRQSRSIPRSYILTVTDPRQVVLYLKNSGVAQPQPKSAAAAEPPGKADVVEIPVAERDVMEGFDLPVVVYGKRSPDGGRPFKTRQGSLGLQVQVEGIAWGQEFGLEGQKGTISPHAGARVVFEGGSIFVKGIDFTEPKARGKTVRVVGTLRLEPKTHTRFGDIGGYYYLEAKSFTTIDAVVDPHLVLVEEKKP